MLKGIRSVLVTLSVCVLFTSTRSFAIAEATQKAHSIRLDEITSVSPMSDGITIRSRVAIMQITALRDDVVRVRASPTGTLENDSSWAVLPSSRTACVNVVSENTRDTVGFKTSTLRVVVTRDSMEMRIEDQGGRVILESYPERPIDYHGSSFRVYMRSPADEHYFGLGDKPGPLDRRNAAFTNWNTEAYGWQESTDPIYKSIPFFITFRKGVSAGIYLDNTWRSSLDFNKEYRDAYSFGANNGPLDYYIMYGPTPKAVVESWAWLTGKTPLPPLWALGFQQSRYSYYSESEVRSVADRLRHEHIPADAIWLDIDYQLKNRPFTVDSERFPHFQQMIQDLKAQHMKTVLITDLHIADLPDAQYRPYDEGKANDYFVKNPDGSPYVGEVWPGKSVFPDFTLKAARDWWGTLYADFVQEGAAGFWNDMNEPSIFNVPSKTMPDDVQHRIEEPGVKTRTASHLEIHNIFGMQNTRGTYEGLLRLAPNQRPFVLTRASFAGGQRYAATWTGDNSSTWNHLRQSIPQLLNLGLSGFAMSGADIGGFAGSPQPELLTQWLQVGAFQPIDRDHTAIGTNPQEPWENGTPEDLRIRRQYIEERYRLLPYLYTTAEEMSRTGVPIVRPLFLEFPNFGMNGEPFDLSAGNMFLLGSDLLIAPSPNPDEVDDYAVHLPPVGWYDYWSGAHLDAKDTSEGRDKADLQQHELLIHRTPDMLPVYVKAGSVIPEQPLVQSTDEKPNGPLTLRVYPPENMDQECRGNIYLDDGMSFAYQKGEYYHATFTCRRADQALVVRIVPDGGTYAPWWNQLSVEVYGITKPASTATLSTLDGAEAVPTSMVYDGEHHRICALVPNNERGVELKLTF